MTGSSFLLLFFNAFLFSFIFWLLTFLAKYFYSNKNYNNKLNYYECGFRSLTNIKIKYKINYILLLLFLLIYDGEFIILIPFSLNITLLNFEVIFLLFIFFFWLVITLLFDYTYKAIEWQV